MTATDTTAVPYVEWDELLRSLGWRQGQHATVIGPTGSGKTTVALALLEYREQAGSHIVCAVTKPRDAQMDTLRGGRGRAYRMRREWQDVGIEPRVLLWPPLRKKADQLTQRRVVGEMLADVFSQGAWTVYLDELRYVVDRQEGLGLQSDVDLLWQQGRSMNITVVATTQRPRMVPLVAYSSSSLLFVFRTNDEEDLRRLGGLGGMSSKIIRDVVANLGRHECLMIDTRNAELARTKAPKPKK